MFKVGDRVKVVNPYNNQQYFNVGAEGIVIVVEDTIVRVKFNSGHYDADNKGEWWAYSEGLELVQKADPAISRSNDPATSKGKRRINKYEQAVLDYLTKHGEEGGTGKSIAESTFTPLNCITPRFAPLRRKGLIKASGAKHDKQIVWVLA